MSCATPSALTLPIPGAMSPRFRELLSHADTRTITI
jgi:hypothetical protein